MRQFFPCHLVFITAIVLDRVAISSSQIGISQSLRALFVLLLLATIVASAIQHFVRDWFRTQFIVLMMPVTLVVYRPLYRLFKTDFPRQADVLGLALLVVLALLYAIIVRRKVWKSFHNPARIAGYFNAVFTILLIFQLVRLGPDGYYLFSQLSYSQTAPAPMLGPDFKLTKGPSSPDIYVIVLDGYARQDVLKNIYKLDNSGFIEELEKRGFYVAKNSHSNYVQTPYTMASFWNLDYLKTWDDPEQYNQYLYEPIQNNRVFQTLNAIGYRTVSFRGEAQFAEVKNSDVYLSNFLPLNDFESLLMVDTPMELLSDTVDLKIPIQTYKAHRQRTLYQLDTLKEIPATIPGSKIVYAHIMVPHPPFVFDRNGDAHEQPRPFTMSEGSESQGGIREYWSGYREQVKFVNGEILQVVDAILRKSASPPVILLMGDHGPASMFKFNPGTPGCLWERTSNLYAMFLPGHERENALYPSISPVNTFRVIFNTYFGTDLPLLEDRSYLMYWYQPTLNVDITDSRDTFAGCAILSAQTSKDAP